MGKNIEMMWDDIRAMAVEDDPDHIFQICCQAMARYGFEFTALRRRSLSNGQAKKDGVKSFFFSDNLMDFLKVYQNADYNFSNLLGLRVSVSHRPFRWREAYADLTTEQQEKIKSAQSYNLNYGYFFPIVEPVGLRGFLTIGRRTDFELSRQEFLEVEMIARHSYEAIERLSGSTNIAEDKTRLSNREAEILIQVSKGKTNWEIGQILSLSEYSIRDYLKELSVRLETSNRTHTVVRAIQLGLILP